MPARDSFGDTADDPEGEGNDGGNAAGDDATGNVPEESIDVAESGELVEQSIEADPTEEPREYLVALAEASVANPTRAGDEIGTLLSIAREHEGDYREDASLILERLGDVRPGEFAVWTEHLRDVADSADETLAFVGLRSFAQLATERPEKAKAGLDPARAVLESDATRLRRAALALVAEVGGNDPEAVRGVDGAIARALRDEEPTIRVAGAIAAGRLLGADPSLFPRTATALPEALGDEHDRVRAYAHVALANVAREHPESVPEKERAIEALAAVTDRELGLREGATDEALAALLEHVTLQ